MPEPLLPKASIMTVKKEKLNFPTEKLVKTEIRLLPSSYNSVLGSYAMDRPILYAQCDHTTALPIFHQKVQGKILYKIAGIISQRLKNKKTGIRFQLHKTV